MYFPHSTNTKILYAVDHPSTLLQDAFIFERHSCVEIYHDQVVSVGESGPGVPGLIPRAALILGSLGQVTCSSLTLVSHSGIMNKCSVVVM